MTLTFSKFIYGVCFIFFRGYQLDFSVFGMNLTLTKVIPEGNQKCPKSKISLFYKSKSPPQKSSLFRAKLKLCLFLKFFEFSYQFISWYNVVKLASRDWKDPKISSQSDTQPDENFSQKFF